MIAAELWQNHVDVDTIGNVWQSFTTNFIWKIFHEIFPRTAALATFSTIFTVPAASAATVNVSAQGRNAFLGSGGHNGWSKITSYKLNGRVRAAAAGVFRLNRRVAD